MGFIQFHLSWVILVLCVQVHAQVGIQGSLRVHVDSLTEHMPDAEPHGLYLQPNALEQEIWRGMIRDILRQHQDSADAKASALEYRVVLFTDTAGGATDTYCVLERMPSAGSHYWGTFVFNLAPRRPRLAILSPHPKHDANTGKQGFLVFQEAGARAYFVSGAHRCNAVAYSPCDGATTVCEPSGEPFRESDQAHAVLGTFQLTLEEMLAVDSDLIVVQPHGFAQQGGDPDLVMSNGTRFTPVEDYLVELREKLLRQDSSLVVRLIHIDPGWDRLAGTTNTQGRLVNGSADPCGSFATEVTGRFLHVEQAYEGLRDTEANWYKLARAVAATFPESCCTRRGDVNSDGRIMVSDVTCLVGYVFGSGPEMQCAGHGDLDADGRVDLGDLAFLVGYLFRGGAVPFGC